MFPHERSLVTKYKGRPFVLLGVNVDEPGSLKKINQRNNLTWSSWADGQQGKISTKWNVQGFPTTFLIDGKGVIRYKDIRKDDDLDKTIEKLIGEEELRLVHSTRN